MTGFNSKRLKADEIRSRIDNDLDLPVLIKQTYISDVDSLATVKGVGYFLSPLENGQIEVGDLITVITGTSTVPVSTDGKVTSVGTFVALA